MEQVKQLRGTLLGLPARAQLAVAGIAVATIVVLFVVISSATRTEWVTASSSLRIEKASAAQQALQDAKIESRLADNGTSVQVPKEFYDKARAALAEVNLLGGAGGHRTCEQIYGDSKSMIAASSAREKFNAKECLQNSIANQIEEINGIDSAAVTLVLPEAEVFSSEQTRPTASITVDTGGSSLEARQVKAISRLTAGSVKSMEAADVTIVDEEGNLLSSESGSGDGATFTDQQAKLRIEAQYNQSFEEKLTRRFEDIAGAGKVKVLSNVELDMDQIRREVKDFGGEGNEQGPKSGQEWDFEQLAKDGTVPGGTAGTPSNVGADPEDRRIAATESTTEDDSGYIHDIAKTTYNNDEVAEAILVAPGAVSRNRVAVIVDSGVSDTNRAAIENAARALMGGNAEDSFDLSEAKLVDGGAVAKGAAAAARRESLLRYGKWVLLGLGLIGMAFLLRRTLNQRTWELLNPGDEVLALERGFEPIPLRELEAAISAASSVENQKRLELQRKVETIAQSKPHDVAQQIRGWLHDSDRR